MGIFTNGTRVRTYLEDADVELPLPDYAVDNHEEVEDAHTGEIDPDPIVDPVEESYIIAAESEKNFSNLMMAVGLRELKSYMESGRDYIHEAPDISGFFKKAKEFFKTLLKKIWSVIKNFIVAIQSRFMKTENFVKKYSKEISEGWKKLDDTDFKLKGYKFTNMKYDESAINKAKSQFEDLYKDIESGEEEPMSVEYFESLCDMLRGECVNKNSVSESEYADELFKYFRNGEDQKDTLNKSDIDISRVIEVMKSGKKAINTAKTAFKKFEDFTNNINQKLTTLENKLIRKSDKEGNAAWAGVTRAVNFAKSTMNITNQANSAYLLAMKNELSQARRVCMIAVQRSNKVDKKLLGESYSYGSAINDVQFI